MTVKKKIRPPVQVSSLVVAIKKYVDYIANLIESPGRCSCWPACARKYVELELKTLLGRVRKIQVGRRESSNGTIVRRR